MLYVVLFFLIFSFYLYVVLGGADYGAGIIELFSSKENQKITKKTVYRVMGPVWEVNHIWLIILIVILWIGFPAYYNVLIINLHIPLTIVLLGVTLRGVAFVFRHYDAVVDKTQYLYDLLFKISSLLTPVFLGIVFGALLSGEINRYDVASELSFYDVYIKSWCNWFSILVGAFYASLCAFLSSILLIGEASSKNKAIYIKKATIATLVVFCFGLILLCYGYFSRNLFVWSFLKNSYAIGILAISGLLLYPLFIMIKKGNVIWSRFFAGLQVFLILLAAIVSRFPHLIITKTCSVSLLKNIAPQSVIHVLGVSLIIGGIVILPGVFHLLKSFKMIKIFDQNSKGN